MKQNILLKRLFAVCFYSCALLMTIVGNPPFFPTDIEVNSKGEIVMTEKGMKRISFYSSDGKKLLRTIPIHDIPTGVQVDNNNVYVTTSNITGYLHKLSLATGKIERSIHTGSGTCSPILDEQGKNIYVCNQFQNTVSEINLEKGEVVRTVQVLREPKSIVFSKDRKYIFVTNFLPAQRADVDYVASCVSVISMDNFKKVKDIKLSNGSNALRGICITPDGKFIYVSHNLGRFTVPTSQLQQGWMNTSAFSVIDVEKQEFMGSIVVDEPERGAAGIWSIACNNEKVFISHSGTHEVSVINHKEMIDKFIKYPDKSQLDYDLRFLYGMRKRIPLKGNGPRKMVLRDGKLFIPTYFADILNIVHVDKEEVSSVLLNPERQESIENKGERFFNDAGHCFQNWQSCNGCHPGDARTDGMNWDLMNDGVGNSKNCKSMLFSHSTAPCMISGIRASAELAVRAGFKLIQFFDITEEDALCVDAYLKSLEPVASPYLINGELSDLAKEGRRVFEKLNCTECHSGPYYTDLKMHRIGMDIEFEKGWDTPTLREVWRTAPYLFDGRAATMEEVFETHKHGITKKVSTKEIKALTEYVNSL